MTDYNIFLTRVAYIMARYFESQVGVCDVHPGMLTIAEQDKLKDNSPLIYTTMSEILQTGLVDNGKVKNDIQMVSFILVYNLSPVERDKLVRELIFKTIELLVGQRWNMEYVYPAAEVKAFDLHGLLRKPDEILGTQGWNPTLQARASDLFGDLPVNSDPQFSIWCVTWEQSLVGEPEKDTAWTIPHTITSLKSTIKLEPSVKSLTLGNWFSQYDVNGTRCLSGKITVVPPDNYAQLITRYDLYWADKTKHRLPYLSKIAGIANNGNLTYTFPSALQVPRDATHIIAYGRSSSHGFSPQATSVPISNIWLGGTSCGTAAAHHPTITVDGKVYKWGGNNASGQPITSGESYSSKTWNTLSGLSSSLTSVQAMGQVGKQIFLLGETNTSFAVAKYNWETKTWETGVNEYSVKETILTGIMLNYDFYILTADVKGYSEKLLLFKSGSDSWLSGDSFGTNTAAPKNPIFNRKQFGICAGNGRVFLLGGKTSTADYLDAFSAYIPGQRKWTTMTALPHKIRDCACIVVSSKLYVLGGELETGKVTNTVLCYDFFSADWESLEPMATSRKEAGVTLLNGNIYITGGIDASGTLLNTMEIYIPVNK